MNAINIKDIENPFLRSAAQVLSYRTNAKGEKLYNFRSLYMDPSGECAISYYGYLTEEQIKEVMINYCYPYEDKCYDEVYPEKGVDYNYNELDDAAGKPFTIIYTPDGFDYRTLK